VWRTLRAVVPSMAENGRVVIVSSGLGKRGRAGYGAYCASKHGVLGLVRALAPELAPRGITINAVCPGWVDTGMAASDLARTARERGTSAAEERAAAEAAIPVGRFVAPAEVAGLIAFLASIEAAAITGQAYNVSGGEF
jgi:NAD(P)-dependent dehydrogenase (short-subunit alcohol dehydrogenase family)